MSHPFPILVAEDDLVSRKLLEKILVKAGYKVRCVENGKAALGVFNEEFFPIVLTDWMMPEMDGLELCKAIRKGATEGYVFIIILTAKDSRDDIVSGLEAGADDYLIKPFNHTELIARINTGIRILELERSLKEANEEIRILSITDPLTGSYNRGYVSKNLAKEIQRSIRYRHPLSLVLCDVDHFKRVNDTYGHQAGDQVLKELVRCINESIRDNLDWLARYGGEEFLIVLPETDLKGALWQAKRLCSSVSQRVIEIDGNRIGITASFGVTAFDGTMPNEKISAEDMINQADKHLYEAKTQGRNRVIGGPLLDPIL
jgi:two-component system cell cycle response regulator